MRKHPAALKSLVLSSLLISGLSSAYASDDDKQFTVTITNITRGMTFTPIITATHKKDINLFDLGAPASENLTFIAESGNIGPLADELSTQSNVVDITNSIEPLAASGGLLLPGNSVTLTLNGEAAKRLSIAAMLIPTNDAFFALDGVRLPKGKRSVTYFSPAYDAGTEPNDESCASIPGPDCGGVGDSPGVDGEGYVFIHAGIHGTGDLVPAERDWRNPVAEIVVKRVDD